MFAIVAALPRYLLSWLRPKHQLALEVLALRHQLTVLKRQTRKPKLRPGDRLLWITLKRFWPGWKGALMIFRPETVIGWQRATAIEVGRHYSKHDFPDASLKMI
jgi:putative transposase